MRALPKAAAAHLSDHLPIAITFEASQDVEGERVDRYPNWAIEENGFEALVREDMRVFLWNQANIPLLKKWAHIGLHQRREESGQQ